MLPLKKAVRPGLTVCVLAKNEEKLLPRCLASVAAIADEIIVVDTGSRDRTVQIAERAGARVLHHRWKDNFSEARNTYVRAARHPWILALDANESIAAHDLRLIREAIRSKAFSAYYLKRRVYTSTNSLYFSWRPLDGRYPAEEKFARTAGFIDSHIVRLFRKKTNDKAIYYDESVHVHENIGESVLRAGGSIGLCHATLHDFSSLKPPGRIRRKDRWYCDLNLREVGTRSFTAHELSNLAICYSFFRRDPDRAIRCMRQALRKKPSASYRYYLAIFLREKGRYDDSELELRKALVVNPRHPDANWLLGVTLDQKGQVQKGLLYLKKALCEVPGHPIYLNSLGVLYHHLGRTREARRCFQRSDKKLPSFTQSRRNLKALQNA